MRGNCCLFINLYAKNTSKFYFLIFLLSFPPVIHCNNFSTKLTKTAKLSSHNNITSIPLKLLTTEPSKIHQQRSLKKPTKVETIQHLDISKISEKSPNLSSVFIANTKNNKVSKKLNNKRLKSNLTSNAEQSSAESVFTLVRNLRPSLFHPASSHFERFEPSDALLRPRPRPIPSPVLDDDPFFSSMNTSPKRMPMPGEYMMHDMQDLINLVEKIQSESKFHPNYVRDVRKLMDMHMEISSMMNEEEERSRSMHHSCYRRCSTAPESRMTCSYNFTVANYYILSPHCLQCPNVTADCTRPGCVAADGRQRAITVVNKLMPGPAIRVCEGDTVVVDVMNQLVGQSAAIHWHGLHQRGTPWMDGVPHLTQCPIEEGSTFRYEFQVPRAGTNYWHSHEGVSRADGMFGALVVRSAPEVNIHAQLYDYDLAEHEIIVWDWLSGLALQGHIQGYVTDERERPQSILVNGKGFPPGFFDTFYPFDDLHRTGKAFVPIHEVRIKPNHSYRFRLISNGITLCPIEFSIEQHTLLVIASDGEDLNPVSVSSLVIHAGERYDFVITGDQYVGSYWMKFRGHIDCGNGENATRTYQLAVLNYEGVPMGELPHHIISSWDDAGPYLPGLQLNPLNIAPGNPEEHITYAGLSSLHDQDPEIIEREYADHQFYLGFDFNPVPNVNFGKPEYGKSHRQMMKEKVQTTHFLPQFNFISHKMPIAPPLTQPETINTINRCNQESKRAEGVDCTKKHCSCTHWLNVELNSIVEIVLVDMGVTFDAAHDFHLHGSSFRVLAIEKLGNTTDPAYVQELDRQGLIQRRRKNAPIKDTVYVPDGGYTIIRFRADNPGFWYFHCHIEFHTTRGMGLIIQVGHPHEMAQAPPHFPRCGNYVPPAAHENFITPYLASQPYPPTHPPPPQLFY